MSSALVSVLSMFTIVAAVTLAVPRQHAPAGDGGLERGGNETRKIKRLEARLPFVGTVAGMASKNVANAVGSGATDVGVAVGQSVNAVGTALGGSASVDVNAVGPGAKAVGVALGGDATAVGTAVGGSARIVQGGVDGGKVIGHAVGGNAQATGDAIGGDAIIGGKDADLERLFNSSFGGDAWSSLMKQHSSGGATGSNNKVAESSGVNATLPGKVFAGDRVVGGWPAIVSPQPEAAKPSPAPQGYLATPMAMQASSATRLARLSTSKAVPIVAAWRMIYYVLLCRV